MIRLPMFLAILAIPTLAAAQDAEAIYRDAVAARRSGDNARAAQLLGTVLRLQPENSDALVQLGFAELARDRLDAAEAAFNRALALAPSYADARIGLARIAQRRGNLKEARALLDPVDAANEDARLLRAQLRESGASPRLGVDLDVTYSDIDEGQQDWHEASLRFSYRPDPATLLTASAEWARRFGREDVYGELRIDRRFSPGASAYLAFGATPEAFFRPKWQVSAGGSARLRSGANPTLLTLEARAAEYQSGDVETLSPGIEQYLFGGKAWLTGRWINTFDEQGGHNGGWLLRGDVQASSRLRLFLGASDASDTSEGVVIETSSLFGGLVWNIDDRLALRASAARETSKAAADRTHLSIGLGIRF